MPIYVSRITSLKAEQTRLPRRQSDLATERDVLLGEKLVEKRRFRALTYKIGILDERDGSLMGFDAAYLEARFAE